MLKLDTVDVWSISVSVHNVFTVNSSKDFELSLKYYKSLLQFIHKSA